MKLAQLKTEANDLISNLSGSRLVFFLDNGSTYIPKISKVDRESLKNITKGFVEKLKLDIVDNQDLTLPLLSNIDDRKNALFIFDYQKKPQEFNALHAASKLPPNSQDFYIPTPTFEDVKAIAFILYGNGKSISLYKNKTPLTVLKNTSNLVNFIMNKQGILEELNNNIFKLDFNYDLFLLNDTFFIKNHRTLEIAMKFHTVITEQSSLALQALKTSGMIDDITHLEKSSADISTARKLAKIAKHSPVLGKIDCPTVINFVSKHKILSCILKTNSNGDKFVIKTKEAQKHFIKLMSDDYLESELTKILYDSLAKDALQIQN
ncbi:DUF4868 domain-containing protein [Enterobacter kobei]|uniref:anti-phage protein KwaB n=1 Tax=Enterobacter kobei TaxID=208224 RepID=UPI002004F209|nr:anti-phage protein KwaB [Enterobacter kobei]MCK7335561.1 DUF4868 domain-containing protein [Enterobacter kobei]